jgi:DNA-binding transcriptional LysR family regulator
VNLSYFKTFVYVADLKSFSRAAEVLNLTQPAVSFQIHALEKAYEEVFFDRSSQQIRLTEAGKVFLKHARDILAANDRLVEELGELKDLVRGNLVLGASNIPGEYILPLMLGEFKKLHPQVSVRLDIMDTGEVIAKLLSHELDVGFCGAAQKKVPLVYEHFAIDELVIALPPGHPLTSKRTIKPTDLKKYPMVVREEGSGTRTVFRDALREAGLSESDFTIVLELGSTQAVLSAVMSGVGITPVSVFALRDHVASGSLSFRKVSGLNLKRPLYIAYNEKAAISKAQLAFVEFLRDNKQLVNSLLPQLGK